MERWNPLKGHVGIISAFNFPNAVYFWNVRGRATLTFIPPPSLITHRREMLIDYPIHANQNHHTSNNTAGAVAHLRQHQRLEARRVHLPRRHRLRQGTNDTARHLFTYTYMYTRIHTRRRLPPPTSDQPPPNNNKKHTHTHTTDHPASPPRVRARPRHRHARLRDGAGGGGGAGGGPPDGAGLLHGEHQGGWVLVCVVRWCA